LFSDGPIAQLKSPPIPEKRAENPIAWWEYTESASWWLSVHVGWLHARCHFQEWTAQNFKNRVHAYHRVGSERPEPACEQTAYDSDLSSQSRVPSDSNRALCW